MPVGAMFGFFFTRVQEPITALNKQPHAMHTDEIIETTLVAADKRFS